MRFGIPSSCEFTTDDGTDYFDACWEIDDYDYADEMSKTECIGSVIAELEKDGYTIEGQPDYVALRRASQRASKLASLRYNLNSQNVEGR